MHSTPCIVLLSPSVILHVLCAAWLYKQYYLSPCGENALYLFSVAALWFITLQVYYTHRAPLLIDQDFQPAVGSFSNFIRLDCNRPVALCV